MGNFVVSARKYRPQKFSEVVGQESITTTLENALRTDHLAHAFLFCGPRGVGKTTCARILARTLNCENVQNDVDPCGECNSCKSFIKNASFNIFELDAASHNSVEDIRTLNEQVRFKPQEGKYKVYIIDEVHMLSSNAFNAFLKTLEEPPSHAIFILATTEKHKILPTILSRCQIFDFKRIQVKDTVKHLQEISKQEGIDAEDDALTVIAQKSDGALRDALSLFDRLASVEDKKITYRSVVANLNLLDYDVFFKTADACLREDVRDVLLIFDKVLNDGFEGDAFLNGLATHFRDLLVCQDPRTIHLQDHSETLKQRYLDQAALMSTSYIFSALNLINQTDISYPQAQNKRLHIEMALSKVCFLNRASTFAPFHTEKKTVDVSTADTKPVSSSISQPRIPIQPPAGQKLSTKEATKQIKIPNDQGPTKLDSNVLPTNKQESTTKQAVSEEPLNQGMPDNKSITPKSAEQDASDHNTVKTPPDLKKISSITPEANALLERNKTVKSDVQPGNDTSQEYPLKDEQHKSKSTLLPGNKITGLSIDIPRLGDISDIQEKVIAAEAEARANSLELSIENILIWWEKCQEELNSPSALSTFKQTNISLKDKTIVLEVNSPLAKTRINEEVDLLTTLRKDFHEPALLIEFEINEGDESLEDRPKKPLTNKEKYELLVTKNTLLKQLRDSLDLAVDNEQ